MGKYFGTDGFRGRANEVLTAEQAFRVGRFLGRYFTDRSGERARIVVGKDTRRSSYMLEYALSAGITASGGDVYLLHVTTTPSVSHLARTEGFDCGVMISASHNPFEDNGIKLVNSEGEKADEALIGRLESYLDGGDVLPHATGAEVGRTVDYVSGRNRYLGYLISLSACSYRHWRVGLDCANGSAWALAKAVFDALGAQTFVIGAQPDGTNINRACGSTHISALQEFVRENRLDIGFAFDGDGDRCICVDERGEVADGDAVLYVCASYLASRGELEGKDVVATVMSNRGLLRSLAERGIGCRCAPVGDRFVYAEMLASGSMLGGESSGHVIFRKYATTGDGILTSLKVMEAMIEQKMPLSALSAGLKRFPQTVRNVSVKRKEELLRLPQIAAAIAAEEERLGKNGRVLVRASGTEEKIRILTEAETESACREAAERLARAVGAEEEGL